ncbi:hypothetical protein O3P69_011219 [Scylla paramamosain]|uniref:Uncharacterized protein n=1 Tax=Scylla paramamosain TaxID=85552 RepID=A0AAW0SUT1_SCYPA
MTHVPHQCASRPCHINRCVEARARHQDDLYHRGISPAQSPHTHYDSRAYLARVTQSGKVDVTNASSFTAYDSLGRGSYLLGLPPQDYKDLRFKQQPHRTWTARPRPDYDDDTTTRDPAIPENPEGLKDPSLLVGPWEEKPTVRVTNAVFK